MKPLATLVCVALLSSLAVYTPAAEPPPPPPQPTDIILQLISQVGSETSEGKEAALSSLGKVTDKNRLDQFGVPEFLLGVAKSGDYTSRVRGAAVDALANMLLNADPAIKDRVLKPLCERALDANEDLYVRCKIADALGLVLKTGIGGVPLPADQIGFTTLERLAAGKEDTALVCAALRAMGRTGYPKAVNMIVKVVGDYNVNPDLKAAALDALQLMLAAGVKITGTDDLIRTLVAMVTDDKVSPDLRVRAARVLVCAIQNGGARSSDVANSVASALDKTADPEIAASLVAVLAGVPEEASVRALEKAYAVFSKSVSDTKEYQKVRVGIAKDLGEYFQPFAKKGQTPAGMTAAEALYNILSKDANPEVLNAAAYSLSSMSDTRYDRTKVVAKLIDMLGDPKLKDAALKSLKVITIRDLGTKPEDWKAWVDSNKNFLLPKG